MLSTDEFHALGKSEAEILGLPGLPLVILPHPMAKRSEAEVAEIAAQVLEEVVEGWTLEPGALAAKHKARVPEAKGRMRYHSLFEGNFNAPDAPASFNAPEGFEAINTLLYRRGWTDGLPVVPPTGERVEAMLGDWDADEVLSLVEPKLGRASVGKVAANAVMAGLEPAQFPVLLAAVRALGEAPLNLKALQTTTHPCTVLTLVNGPAGEAAGLNATYNAMGQGRLANAAIGRAMRFVLLNIGGATPGVLDRSTQGNPAKYAFCLAENEADSPWGPFHATRGFEAGQSAVTLAGVEGPHNINDHFGTTAEEVLLTIAGSLAVTGANNCYLGGEIMLILGPEHAEIIARDGFTRLDTQQFLLERAIIPGHHISEPQAKAMAQRVADRFIDGDWRNGSHILSAPDELQIVTVGAAGRHSAVLFSFGSTRAVTVPVTDATGSTL